jgi:hypothetical protein
MGIRWFYLGMAVAMAITVLVGFGPTYFVRPLYHQTPLPLLAQVHGALFVTWIALCWRRRRSWPDDEPTYTGA